MQTATHTTTPATIMTPTEAEALDNHAEQQARAQYEGIVQMLAAVACDYDRLQELRDEREELAEELAEAEKEHATALEEAAAAEGRHAAACASYASSTSQAEALKEARATLEEAATALDEAREALTGWDDDNADELAELEIGRAHV
mgnify:CR=1 FL=1